MDLSVTAAYIKIFNLQSIFSSNLSLPHLHVNQKSIPKTHEQTDKPILKHRQKRIPRKAEIYQTKTNHKQRDLCMA